MKAPWTKHSQAAYKLLAKNRQAPAFLRIAWLAMGRHGSNGHAEFRRGELASLLNQNGKPYRRVDDAIATAIQYGMLDASSTRRCLVVPCDLIEGPHGKFVKCHTHQGRPPVKMADCHPNRKHHAKGLCSACYQSEWRLKSIRRTIQRVS